MTDVAEAVDSASWKKFAIQLELKITDINRIDQEQRGNIHNCFIEVFDLWERIASRPYTWATIIDALHCVGEIRLATKIKKNLSRQPAACSKCVHLGGDPGIPSDPPRKRRQTL